MRYNINMKNSHSFGKVFVDSNHPRFFIVNDFFAFLTIVSVIAVVLETVPAMQQYASIFVIIEWTVAILFTVEYLARLVATKPSYKYIFSFFGVIDLVSILPTFLGLGNLTFLKSARALRIIRLLRLIRASALRSHKKDEDYNPIAFNVLIYFSTLLLALLIFGTLMYLVEGGEMFYSIPAGMWWSLKVFMAGVPVEAPLTAAGDALFVLTRFSGLLLLGLLIGVVGNVFRLLLDSPAK